METGRASRTAMASAYIRAAHLREDPPPWVLEDRLAEKFVGPQARSTFDDMWAAISPEIRAAFRGWFVTRARLAEEVAVDGLAANRRDYVILGAGADTFAWRHPRATDFKITELDRTDTLAWKRSVLGAAGLSEPTNLRFVPVDLASTKLSELELPATATWNWLGVTMYLERRAVEVTLRSIAAGGAGTTAIVEFGLNPDNASDVGRAFQQQAVAGAAAVGERMFGFYDPAEIPTLMRSCGFRSVDLFDAEALRWRYWGTRTGMALPDTVILAVAAS